MCYDRDARPPPPPIAGAAAEEGELVLTAADGNRLAAYAARAASPTGAGIVILPDVRGLHPFSTRSWPGGSPRPGSTRSRSTTSGARPGPGRATTASTS
jgi:hypothetical protein